MRLASLFKFATLNTKMKNLFGLIFTALCLGCNAQLFDFRRIEYGIVEGINASKVQHAHNPSQYPRISFYSGIFAKIPFDKECSCLRQNYYIQPQLEYIQLGEKGGLKTLYAVNYLSLDVFFKAYIPYNEYSSFFILLGPRLSVLLHQNVVNPPKDRPYKIEQNGKANNKDFAGVVATGFSLNNRKLDLILRFDYSFSNQYPNLNEYETTGDPLAKLRKIQYSLSAGFSYVLF